MFAMKEWVQSRPSQHKDIMATSKRVSQILRCPSKAWSMWVQRRTSGESNEPYVATQRPLASRSRRRLRFADQSSLAK
eukprot:CAMPEP_0180782740 /NCGR_PEP_ID=MMETSP1038_2-20121128/48547_1 /TAXON_ID=632150 /ORGANISM="Azadinium spinosum, Strain 3D9" /LENGTH=77 /DNA_ID=CAMNT_0022819053 /DNA_START=87 /DNA_END=320 /DNA_ORIENTATION=-